MLWWFCFLILNFFFISLSSTYHSHQKRRNEREKIHFLKLHLWIAILAQWHFQSLGNLVEVSKISTLPLTLFLEPLWNYLGMRKNIWNQGDPRNPSCIAEQTSASCHMWQPAWVTRTCRTRTIIAPVPRARGRLPSHRLQVSVQLPAFDLPQILCPIEFFFFSKLNCLTLFVCF